MNLVWCISFCVFINTHALSLLLGKTTSLTEILMCSTHPDPLNSISAHEFRCWRQKTKCLLWVWSLFLRTQPVFGAVLNFLHSSQSYSFLEPILCLPIILQHCELRCKKQVKPLFFPRPNLKLWTALLIDIGLTCSYRVSISHQAIGGQ